MRPPHTQTHRHTHMRARLRRTRAPARPQSPTAFVHAVRVPQHRAQAITRMYGVLETVQVRGRRKCVLPWLYDKMRVPMQAAKDREGEGAKKAPAAAGAAAKKSE